MSIIRHIIIIQTCSPFVHLVISGEKYDLYSILWAMECRLQITVNGGYSIPNPLPCTRFNRFAACLESPAYSGPLNRPLDAYRAVCVVAANGTDRGRAGSTQGRGAADLGRARSRLASGWAAGADCQPEPWQRGRLEHVQATAFARNAFWIGPRPTLPRVPSRRGAEASSVAKVACTIITMPTIA
jgi:hypothetical protein